MPFSKRGRLLVRLAALVILGAAATGCQSTPVYRASMPGDCLPGQVSEQAATQWTGVAQPARAEERLVPVAASEPQVPAVNTLEIPPLQPPAYAPRPMQASPAPAGARPSGVTFFPTPPGRKSMAAVLFGRPTTQEPPRLAPPAAPSMSYRPVPCQGGCASAVMLRPVPVGENRPGESGFMPAQRVAAEPGPDARTASFVPAARPGDAPGGVPAFEANPIAAPPPTEKLGPPRVANNGLNKPRVKTPEGYPDLPLPTVTHPPAAPREFAKRALSDYIIEPPDVLQIDLLTAVSDKNFPVRGTHLVRPDGTIGLGAYGSVFVAGLTLEQAKLKIADWITKSLFEEKDYSEKFKLVVQALKVDVTAYNSKFYYIIADGGGYGEQVYRVLCTGNETILDAIAQVEGLPRVASKSKIWIARATPTEVHEPNILPVDWVAVTQLGHAATNYQIYPGDRIYVNSDVRIRIDSHLAKIISPIERLFGITLLGSTTVNSIKGNQGGGGGRGF